MLSSQFSAIFDNFRQKIWRFTPKPIKNSFVLSQKRQLFAVFLAKIF
jgi:hypothetical protein